MTSPVERAIDLITARLTAGITHPGNQTTGQPPKLLVLPGFDTNGIPPEMAQHFATEAGLPPNDAPRLLAEAIVHTLHTEAGLDLIPHAELAQLQAQLAEPDTDHGSQVTIHCRCNTQPLAVITTSRAQAPINGPALRARLDQTCTCT